MMDTKVETVASGLEKKKNDINLAVSNASEVVGA